ncbi:hypothetical protein B0H13DRAFT_2335335 [Mycena leptocephala]|nr:hypothetical protein B0H13DRAFT_2335335 [Mycena leptocephala]
MPSFLHRVRVDPRHLSLLHSIPPRFTSRLHSLGLLPFFYLGTYVLIRSPLPSSLVLLLSLPVISLAVMYASPPLLSASLECQSGGAHHGMHHSLGVQYWRHVRVVSIPHFSILDRSSLAGPSLRSVLDQCGWRILARVRVRSIMDWMKVRAGACFARRMRERVTPISTLRISSPSPRILARPLSIPFLAVPVPVPSPRSSLLPIVCACPSCGIQELVPPRARAAGSIPRQGVDVRPRLCGATSQLEDCGVRAEILCSPSHLINSKTTPCALRGLSHCDAPTSHGRRQLLRIPTSIWSFARAASAATSTPTETTMRRPPHHPAFPCLDLDLHIHPPPTSDPVVSRPCLYRRHCHAAVEIPVSLDGGFGELGEKGEIGGLAGEVDEARGYRNRIPSDVDPPYARLRSADVVRDQCRFPSRWRSVFEVWVGGAGMDEDGCSLRGRIVCGTAFSTLWASVWRSAVLSDPRMPTSTARQVDARSTIFRPPSGLRADAGFVGLASMPEAPISPLRTCFPLAGVFDAGERRGVGTRQGKEMDLSARNRPLGVPNLYRGRPGPCPRILRHSFDSGSRRVSACCIAKSTPSGAGIPAPARRYLWERSQCPKSDESEIWWWRIDTDAAKVGTPRPFLLAQRRILVSTQAASCSF